MLTLAVEIGEKCRNCTLGSARTGPFTDESASAIPATVFSLLSPPAQDLPCAANETLATAVDLETSRS